MRGNKLGSNSLGQVTYSGFIPSKGRLCVVARCLLERQNEGVIKQLVALEQELATLVRLQTHPNLVPWLGLSYSPVKGDVEVFVAQELVQGAALSTNLGLKMEQELLKSVCRGVLAGLAHLHQADLVHRDLRPSSVFLCSEGRVRMADFCLDSKLRELALETNHITVEESLPPAPGRR